MECTLETAEPNVMHANTWSAADDELLRVLYRDNEAAPPAERETDDELAIILTTAHGVPRTGRQCRSRIAWLRMRDSGKSGGNKSSANKAAPVTSPPETRPEPAVVRYAVVEPCTCETVRDPTRIREFETEAHRRVRTGPVVRAPNQGPGNLVWTPYSRDVLLELYRSHCGRPNPLQSSPFRKKLVGKCWRKIAQDMSTVTGVYRSVSACKQRVQIVLSRLQGKAKLGQAGKNIKEPNLVLGDPFGDARNEARGSAVEIGGSCSASFQGRDETDPERPQDRCDREGVTKWTPRMDSVLREQFLKDFVGPSEFSRLHEDFCRQTGVHVSMEDLRQKIKNLQESNTASKLRVDVGSGQIGNVAEPRRYVPSKRKPRRKDVLDSEKTVVCGIQALAELAARESRGISKPRPNSTLGRSSTPSTSTSDANCASRDATAGKSSSFRRVVEGPISTSASARPSSSPSTSPSAPTLASPSAPPPVPTSAPTSTPRLAPTLASSMAPGSAPGSVPASVPRRAANPAPGSASGLAGTPTPTQTPTPTPSPGPTTASTPAQTSAPALAAAASQPSSKHAPPTGPGAKLVNQRTSDANTETAAPTEDAHGPGGAAPVSGPESSPGGGNGALSGLQSVTNAKMSEGLTCPPQNVRWTGYEDETLHGIVSPLTFIDWEVIARDLSALVPVARSADSVKARYRRIARVKAAERGALLLSLTPSEQESARTWSLKDDAALLTVARNVTLSLPSRTLDFVLIAKSLNHEVPRDMPYTEESCRIRMQHLGLLNVDGTLRFLTKNVAEILANRIIGLHAKDFSNITTHGEVFEVPDYVEELVEIHNAYVDGLEAGKILEAPISDEMNVDDN